MSTYLLLHGWGGKAKEHWLSWLADELAKQGKEVIYPLFPKADEPQKAKWLKALDEQLSGIDLSQLKIAAHSLGCSLWLHYLQENPRTKIQKAILVAPPYSDPSIPEVASFFPTPKLKLENSYLIIGSDNDPFIAKEDFELAARSLQAPFHFIPNAGHLNIGSGYGPWPWLLKQILT